MPLASCGDLHGGIYLNIASIADEKEVQPHDAGNVALRASAKPFVFRASAAAFSPTFVPVQSTSSSASATPEFAALSPPPLPATPSEAGTCGKTPIDTSEAKAGMNNVPRKITLSFEKAAALFAAGAAKTKMFYGNLILTLAQKIQLKQLQVAM